MNNNYQSDILEKASQACNNLFEDFLKQVLSILDDRKLEKNKDTVASVLAECMTEDKTVAEDLNSYIPVFTHVLKQILEYLGIQKSSLFFNNDEKKLTEIKEMLVAKVKEYQEKKLEKGVQKEKRIAGFKPILLGLDFDYLKAFIERIGLSHFAALNLLTHVRKLEEKLEQDDINLFTSDIKEKIKKIEEKEWKNQEELSPIKNALESLLLIAEELPGLKQLLEKKGTILSYSDLVDLLKIKNAEVSDTKINPLKEGFYNSLKEMALIIFEEANLEKTKEGITTAFITAITVLKREDPNTDITLGSMPNLLSEFLNRLLKESKVIQNDLSQDEIEDLIDKKTKEVAIDVLEAELKKGVKPTVTIPSDFNVLSGVAFESLLERLFKKLGYLVVKTPPTGDQGADLLIEKNDEKIVVQAKRYCGAVSNKAIQEAVAAIGYYKCNRAIVVTTSIFTKSALKLAISNKVELWDGKKLKEIVNEINK